ncbi:MULTISPECIES: tyrosine-type recombinase/integrase [Bradyrhizobium]|uniref:tyrosine-type recombinase/integrase n=1 Tax=Bradyrhizobium TaxID=374 RepID=UPI00155EB269|nr:MULTISPECIES: site-specific integrase [Bradyrhizobium]MDD1523460.1 site-specific integrase [Bradyrhizobium sp. WBAH30]MDD1547546.1 site-specific integrase [Bradyrhizobium sp. WBAH41]MDD1561185.1 site-specific integrase [Bradyrhizobium sp. WBAH23]MDD1568661.1 site-specific integrase [Bradyrhizobium sp. WBAH33]MDD1594639.1 site-specific integrase [Bradyrhizobium sp. WBAH42]
MPLRLYQRDGSPNWYLRGTLRGILVRESCQTDDRKIAQEIKAKREWEILQRSVYGVKASGTFLGAAAIYLENDGDARFLQPLIDHFGSMAIAKIDQAAADAAAKAIYPGLAPATINRQLYTPLSAVINMAASKGYGSPVKFTRPKLPKGRVRWITHAEAFTLIEACAPHLKPLVAFLFYTGARVGEALWLDWRNVDLSRAQVQFLDTKNGRDRGVPLHPDLVAILANLPHREGEVFRKQGRIIRKFVPARSNSGEPIEVIEDVLGDPYAPLDPDDPRDVSAGSRIKKGFKAAVTRAKIKDFHPHDCRHTWATWHYQENRDLNMLMHLGGWSSLSMVLRYAHVNVAHAAPSIQKMPSIGPAPPKAAKLTPVKARSRKRAS